MNKQTKQISALIAVGGSLAALPAAALELGEAKVNSSLGQPLRVSIAYALAPTETLATSCVSLQGGAATGGVPVAGPATLNVANGVISIMGQSPIREPLVSLRLNVRCAYTPQLSRDYTLFIDPPGLATAGAEEVSVPATAPVPAPAATVAPTTAAVPAPAVTRTAPKAPAAPTVRRSTQSTPAIPGGKQYRVQPGDTLGEIVQRIEDRQMGLWAAVEAVFASNPHAFLNNDPNRLKAGSWLTLPDFAGGTAAVSETVATAEQPEVDVASSTAGVAVTSAAEAVEPAPVLEPGLGVVPAATTEADFYTPSQTAAPAETLEATDPYMSGYRASDISIPDTELEPPVTRSASPNVPTATIQPAAVDYEGTTWWPWLTGAALAVFGFVLFFSRRRRTEPETSVRYAANAAGEPVSTESPRYLDQTTEIKVEYGELDDTDENFALDADLVIGTGLQAGGDVEHAGDFGSSQPTDLDFELPEEMSSLPEAELAPEATIVLESAPMDSEAGVGDDYDQTGYDISVILDATKGPMSDEAAETVTTKMLPVEADDEDGDTELLSTNEYALTEDPDFDLSILGEGDELGDTAILQNDDELCVDDLTEELNAATATLAASVAALDMTTQGSANDDESLDDLDETTINKALR